MNNAEIACAGASPHAANVVFIRMLYDEDATLLSIFKTTANDDMPCADLFCTIRTICGILTSMPPTDAHHEMNETSCAIISGFMMITKNDPPPAARGVWGLGD